MSPNCVNANNPALAHVDTSRFACAGLAEMQKRRRAEAEIKPRASTHTVLPANGRGENQKKRLHQDIA